VLYLLAFVGLCKEKGHLVLRGMTWHGDGGLCMNDTLRRSECHGMFEHRGFAGAQALRGGKVGLVVELRGLLLVLVRWP